MAGAATVTLRADGDGGSTHAGWSRARHAAMTAEQLAHAVSLRPGSTTLIGAQELIDALDHYWQVRYGGRVVIVKPEEPGDV